MAGKKLEKNINTKSAARARLKFWFTQAAIGIFGTQESQNLTTWIVTTYPTTTYSMLLSTYVMKSS